MQKENFSSLIIAGSDSGGGAGIQGDLKTFSFHCVYASTVITALTAQNTLGVDAVYNIPAHFIEKQLKSITSDFKIRYIKIGMLSNIEVIDIVTFCLKKYLCEIPIILDPVMYAKGGHSLLNKDAVDHLIKKLIPLSYLVTPNIPEAKVILGTSISNSDEMLNKISKFKKLGIKKVLLKGGHLKSENKIVKDVLLDKEDIFVFESEYINTKNTHGTGCSLASAITANLFLNHSTYKSVSYARDYVHQAIKLSLEVGSGHNPLNHFYKLFK